MQDIGFKQFVAPVKINKPDEATQYFQDLQDTILELQQTVLNLNSEIETLKSK